MLNMVLLALFLSHTLFISSFGFNQMSPPLWERQALLPFGLQKPPPLPRSFPFQCFSLTSVCHIPDPPLASLEASLSSFLFFTHQAATPEL